MENYLDLKGRLIEQGIRFSSQTDTEVIAHLIGLYERETGDFVAAFGKAMQDLRGGNAVVAMNRNHHGLILAARLGYAGAVVIGLGNGETFVASDVPAILDYTQRMVFLDDGEMALVTSEGPRFFRISGEPIEKEIVTVAWDPVSAAKGGYKHFMQKEIFEQPRAISDCLGGRVDVEVGEVHLNDLLLSDEDLRRIDKIYAVACGTALYACLLGKFFIETLAGVRVETDYGSEFRYRNPILDERTLLLAVTQSGETVDTLAAMEAARAAGVKSVSIVNAIGSQAARLANGGVIYLNAGPEIGVASTKAFTTMIIALYLFALRLAQARGRIERSRMRQEIQSLLEIPNHVGDLLRDTSIYAELVDRYHRASNMLYLGRWVNYPIALEGALKMKEISYIHAEGYPAGEMKHGPIALIDEQMPVVCIAIRDQVYEKMLSNVEQVRARGGEVIAIATEGDGLIAEKAQHVIYVPRTAPLLSPIVTTIPLQLLAYYMAVRRGADVDQPRNLAKSVTVE
ncbi:MAG: glutamine--fructose-6-phosphate aminotransferase [isomerizing] [Herpetosiphonaceae bacterium]|nr:MAG: glutamine--fructose-6-phosphate aminotransferase [isomerizing] [Herpetosiphonaceae bacterium]